jgi:hypothetical protein
MHKADRRVGIRAFLVVEVDPQNHQEGLEDKVPHLIQATQDHEVDHLLDKVDLHLEVDEDDLEEADGAD